MADTMRFTVTLKGGLVASQPERRQEDVREQLEQEGLLEDVDTSGKLVNYRSGQGRLHASIDVTGSISDLNLPRFERALARGAGGKAKGWSVKPA